MDEKFFRYWAEIFRQTAEGQARMDEFRRWMESGMRTTVEFWEMFRKWFDPEKDVTGWQPGKSFEEITAEFNQTIGRFMNGFGMIPKSAYLDLDEKYRALKQRVEEQEETIRRLRRIVAEQEIGERSGADRFAELLADQQRQIRQWIEMFTPGAVKENEEK